MKKIFLFSLFAVFLTTQANAEGWSQYNRNNIIDACVKKSQKSPPASITSADFGCACFVDNISQKISFEEMRRNREPSKYHQYLIEDANAKCNSNYPLK